MLNGKGETEDRRMDYCWLQLVLSLIAMSGLATFILAVRTDAAYHTYRYAVDQMEAPLDWIYKWTLFFSGCVMLFSLVGCIGVCVLRRKLKHNS